MKKYKKNYMNLISKGRINIQVSINNIIITFTDLDGQVIYWSSAGTSGFRGTRKGTPYAAQITGYNMIHKLSEYGINNIEIFIKGLGFGREASLRTFHLNGISINFIQDKTSISHNGCRSPKKRRV
uniref:Small ribosomal subunit protein uS11c n=1 Tax=Didymoplexis pallens TaxID=2848458 RepID=A0A976UFJ9_9ASPA|nr:ribosomal protein S11 [Didymoplexis pallens]UVG41008.1 ribosomal protein S11 [Didymoplexis pallens]